MRHNSNDREKEPVKKYRHVVERENVWSKHYILGRSGNAPEQVELTFVVDQDLKGVDKPYFSRLSVKPLRM